MIATALKEKSLKILYKFIDKIDSRRWKSHWQKSDWSVLSSNADEYIVMMDLAYQNRIYSQVLHNGHIAVELILKSAMSKQYKQHLFGHEILSLVAVEIYGAPILNEINKDIATQTSFNQIYSAWSMQYRYRVKKVTGAEAGVYLNAFKEAFKWTKTKYSL